MLRNHTWRVTQRRWMLQPNEFLRVLCPLQASTQRTPRLSVTSVFKLFLFPENTEKKKRRYAWKGDDVDGFRNFGR